MRPTAVIAIGNQKGGVGKTTITVNLAAALGELGHKVLIIDLDPSAGATHHLGIDPYAYEGTVELLTGQGAPIDLAITEGMPKNVSLIPARDELASLDTDHVTWLRAGLDGLRQTREDQEDRQIPGAFDYILLDTPPNPKSPNTFAAYATADWFLFVTTPHDLPVRGLTEALRDVGTVRQSDNPSLEVLGVVFTAVDTRTLALRDTKAFLKKHPGLRPFGREGFIPLSVFPNRAVQQGVSVFQLKGHRCREVTSRFKRIAKAVVKRCADRERSSANRRKRTKRAA